MLLTVCAAATWAPAASADDASSSVIEDEGPRTRPVALRHDVWIDGAVMVGLAGSLLTLVALKPKLSAKTCAICDGDGPGTLNALDRAFRDAFHRRDPGPASTLGDIVSYGVGPVAAVSLSVAVAAADRRMKEAPLNVMLCLEAALVAVTVKESLTLALPRERPDTHAATGEERERLLATGTPVESFPSGHVGSIMALTSSAAVIATMRGYRLAPLIWVVGTTLAVTAGYLRIAADRHYFTDTLAGAAIGTGVGAAVPLLFHPPLKDGAADLAANASSRGGLLRGAILTTTPVQGGRTMNVTWAF